MTDDRTLTCRCGETEWVINTAGGTHVVCHCADCQTFATHLSPDQVPTDPAGGTHLLQTLPDHVTFLKGTENLGCLRLSPKALMRWYTTCCRTPVANTLPRPGIPFVGLVLPPETQDFGKVTARAFTESAKRPVETYGMARAGLGVLRRALLGRIAGAHRRSPFVTPDGSPIATPTVLTREERAAARPG
ncbi:DUF6151 family protein [Palleronia sp. THAF1]|uniref:DUF6151 family protein n=1 Tax=Palleronia sp. THAF1 TaxID=2587842 RepID=UPI001268843A|nr:DUF6151 family protein [Palleronia sp. THAF1]